MKTLPIINQLKKRCTIFNNRVFGLKEWLDLNNKSTINPQTLPACWVVCTQETASEEQRSAVSYYQTIKATFDVFVAVDRGDAHGQIGADNLDGFATIVRKALCGFAPIEDDQQSAMTYQGFSFLKSSGPWVIIDMEFTSTYELSQEDTDIQTVIDEMEPFEEVKLDVDLIKDGEPDGNIEYSTILNIPTN